MPPRPPRATYRLQLQPRFGFAEAAALVDYLAELGVSHLYLSPVLQARHGSTHGYDVVDHAHANRELGGEEGFARLADGLSERGMGLVLDIVPNHMAIGGEENRWWWDLLEHGRASRYASYFDVDWDPPEARLRNVILLPVLDDHYGRVLEARRLCLVRRGGRLLVAFGEGRFPLDPRSIAPLLSAAGRAAGSDELGFIGAALADLPAATTADPDEVARRQRDAEVLAGRLEVLAADRGIAEALDGAVAAVNGDADALDELLNGQSYRLAYWRASSRDLGYRRFFDINELVGLRMEEAEVFEATHAHLLDWVARGRVDGLRIDHPDGLRDPAGYFARLRDRAPKAWLLVEKILQPGEPLRAEWPVDGTTGYEFLNEVTGLFVEPRGEEPFTRLWLRVSGEEAGWDEVAREARREVLGSVLGSDLNRLTDLFVTIAEENRRYRDFTRHELHEALRELAAALPVYRTYVRARSGQVDQLDRQLIGEAAEAAAAARPDLDPELFAFLARILLLELPGAAERELAMRFQQLTPAAMAKGVEDTAMYRYLRFVALNEVGGEPGRFGVTPAVFHAAMTRRSEAHPAAMLAGSTHDTKRSEEVRARLVLLSELPEAWSAFVERLETATARHASGDDLPDPATRYLLWQTLVGAWPIDPVRLGDYMEKAVREAKRRTSWNAPDEAYEAALRRFVEAVLADPEVRDEVERFVAPLVEPGRRTSLAMLLLRLTAPGVPDLYQGRELWDASLVDPDNRRPVDFERRRELLARASTVTAEEAWADRESGLPRIWLTRRVLRLRAERPELFAPQSAYRAREAEGDAAARVVAFARAERLVVVVPRLAWQLSRNGWGEARLPLPPGSWRNVLTDASVAGSAPPVGSLLEGFPVALLVREA